MVDFDPNDLDFTEFNLDTDIDEAEPEMDFEEGGEFLDEEVALPPPKKAAPAKKAPAKVEPTPAPAPAPAKKAEAKATKLPEVISEKVELEYVSLNIPANKMGDLYKFVGSLF